MAAILVAAAYPAYADDTATTAQELIDIWTDIRNDHLVEFYFEKSYTTPEMATIGTVNSAIELYDATRAEPQVQVRDRGNFVKHPANPYGTTVVAFEVINSMNTDEEVYPFVIDAGTLKMLAEGAFPGTVGLSAVFLHDTDRSLEEILTDLQESDGTWVTYVFNDPSTGRYENKHTWLSLYDGYIFGAGYYTSPDDVILDSVSTMLRMYDTNGADSFTTLQTDSGVSFVLDAETLEIVAHTNPDITGSAIKDALDANWPLESLLDVLGEHESMWVSYPTPDPRPGSEFTRAHLQLHDNHIFGSGYGLTPDVWLQSLTSEAVQLYEMEGESAYQIITSMEMMGVQQIVSEADDHTIRAFSGQPHLVGRTVNPAFDLEHEDLLQYLSDNPGLWADTIYVSPSGASPVELRRNGWMILHDERLFAASRVYSPETATIGTVDTAIALYKAHGEEAFDRITWQSVRPEIIYPFVVDAQTWELVAHAAVPERVGVCCAAPIAASNDLDAARQDLEQNSGIWLEYTFYNPITERYEYKRTYLTTYDGYTFAAGYYYGSFEQSEIAIQKAIDLYDAQGEDAAFADINAMMVDTNYPLVIDRETLNVVAHGQNPGLVGANFLDVVGATSRIVDKIEAELRNDGDTTFNFGIPDPATGSQTANIILFQLHGGYIFAAEQPFVIYTR